jgi:hypothetical protein
LGTLNNEDLLNYLLIGYVPEEKLFDGRKP